MGISVEYEANTGILVIKAEGEVGFEDFIGVIGQLERVPEVQEGTLTLWDVRGVTAPMTASISDMRGAVDVNPDYQRLRGRGRSAVLVSRDIDFGMSRMFQSYQDGGDVESGVFRDETEARGWLLEWKR